MSASRTFRQTFRQLSLSISKSGSATEYCGGTAVEYELLGMFLLCPHTQPGLFLVPDPICDFHGQDLGVQQLCGECPAFFFFSCSKPRNLSVSGSEGEEGAQTSRRSMAWSRSSSGRKEPAEVVQASDQTLKCSNNNSHKKKYAYTTYTVHTQFNNNRSQFLHFSQH